MVHALGEGCRCFQTQKVHVKRWPRFGEGRERRQRGHHWIDAGTGATRDSLATRRRSVGSIRAQLIAKAREAAIAAIRSYNDPSTQFKSETFIVLMVIGWTYLLHAYYRSKGVEYRYFRQGPKRRVFDRTKHGAYKHWELERCLNCDSSPLDRDTANNLRFLIGLRHEIEHQGTQGVDAFLSGRYQACAMNFNH